MGFWLVPGGIFDLGRNIVVVVMEDEMEDLELMVKLVMRGLLEWEDVFLVTLESDVSKSEFIQHQQAFLWDGDADRFLGVYFCLWIVFISRRRLIHKWK